MRDYYAVWSVYDADHDVSVPLYRAVLVDRNLDIATEKAKALSEQVLKFYQDSRRGYQVNNVDEIEVQVRLLDQWISQLKQRGSQLKQAAKRAEEGQ